MALDNNKKPVIRPASLVASLLGLALALVAITVLVKLSGTDSVAVHLFYLPIIYAAFVFGDYGAILVALMAAMACGVWMPAHYGPDARAVDQTLLDIIVRAAIFYVVAIVCSRAFTELKRRITEQRTLYKVAASITSTLRIREVLDLIADHALEVMNAKGCGIRLLDPETDELRLAATAGLSDDYWGKGPVSSADSTVDQAVLRGEVKEVYDAASDPRIRYKEAARRAGVASLLTVPLHSKDRIIGRIRVYTKRPRRFRPREIELLNAFADQASVAIENAQLYEDIRRNYYETVRALTRAIEAKDLATFSHSERVTQLVDEMAKEAGVSPDQRELLRFGSILHDVGKIGVAEESLEARDSEDAERVFYEMHPLIGQSILKPVSFLEPIISSVLYHHERWDGHGFPEGRQGNQIPEMARMVCLADAFDRLRYPNDKNGEPGMTVREALEQITTEASSRFDPDLVRILRRVVMSGGQEPEADGPQSSEPEAPES